MENGAYLLATCFESIISIFGMALPQVEGDFTKLVANRPNVFLSKKGSANLLVTDSSKVSWVCLLQFPCAKRYPGLSISQFAYTGSNSLLISIGTEIHIYSCMVRGSKLEAFTPSQTGKRAVSKTPSRVFRQRENLEGSGKLSDSDIINLLDFAHARNTPLPQYHPKILLELMNSGKLHAVRAILVNLVKYLLLYESRQTSSEDEGESSFAYGSKDHDNGGSSKRKRMLSVSSDGQLRRSHHLGSKIEVETIPSLSLSKLGIFGTSSASTGEQESTRRDLTERGVEESTEGLDEDDLFTLTATPKEEDFSFSFNEDGEKELDFSDINPATSDLTPEMSAKLTRILQCAQLADLSDLEQVRLMAIAETVANTRMAFDRQLASSVAGGSAPTSMSDPVAPVLGFTAGAGYASTSLAQGVGGGEAMDDCGIRYLLALKNYLSLSESLPSGVRPGRLSPADFIWAFHSDAEMELLAALPCVQRDDLRWSELRNAGVGWWLRSLDTLRRLMERLAKTQFMAKQDPLDSSLLYLAMKKKSLLKGLFRTVGDSRMTKFFAEDFTTERWKRAALKNAFALLSKQRFEHAAAFFLLGGKVWDACEVCISRMGDLQLALVITRLYEGDGGPVYEKILKKTILGISDAAAPTGGRMDRERKQGYVARPNSDPFLRSIACWLLQDYSAALETLLRSEYATDGDTEGPFKPLDPAIFNFYFFLRSQPLLIRRNQHDYRSLRKKSHSLLPSMSVHHDRYSSRSQPISSVGDEPLTALERNLLFGTAYHHLNHGCPLLALDVLAKLPKSSSLGADLNQDERSRSDPTKGGLRAEEAKMGKKRKKIDPTASLTGMIQSGTLREFDYAPKSKGIRTDSVAEEEEEEEEEDWSKPVTLRNETIDDMDWSQPAAPIGRTGNEEDGEIDWSKPITAHMLTGPQNEGEGGDDIDWSQPVSSQFESKRSPSLSPPHFDGQGAFSPPSESAVLEGSEESDGISSYPTLTTLSSQGLFVLSLAEQLQYNACLSILTEELITIHLPPCCDFLWEKGGRAALPLLPLAKSQEEKQLASHCRENAFEKTVLKLRGMLVVWLRREMGIVKEICGFDSGRDDLEESSEDYVPAGYDLLTTLMNYTSLHAGTTPSLITIKLELMHLMNTLLPWSTQLTRTETNVDGETGSTSLVAPPLGGNFPTCAVDPSQLPILTSCSLPAKHLTNLALHLRLMSASVIEVLANHTCPPISSTPLPHVSKVFELCCAISNSITVCLTPINITEIASDFLLSPPDHKSGRSSSFASSEAFELPTTPNTKASKWPGVSRWPKALQSDEGKDPTPMSLILAECCIAMYVGLLSVAWSRHSIGDLLLLLKNCPSQEFWYLAFGGGVDVKRSEEKQQKGGVGGERSVFMKKVDTMKKMLQKVVLKSGEAAGHGLFVAPKRTLLQLFLDSPTDDRSESNQAITFTTHRTLSNASTIAPEFKEDEEEEEEEEYFMGDPYMEEGPSFRLGSVSKEDDIRDPKNPDSFPWCLMNLCITKLVQEGVRKILTTAGLEVLELVTASPLLYSTLKVLDEWESIFARRLDALEMLPEELFTRDDEDTGALFVGVGPAVMRHKFILEPENSPFLGQRAAAKEARQLWEFLVHREECREIFIHHIFSSKGGTGESGAHVGPSSRSLFKAPDSVIWSFCIHPAAQWNPTIMAVALPREIIEIEIPDVAGLDSVPYGDEMSDTMSVGPGTVPKRSHSVAFTGAGDFILVQPAPYPTSSTEANTALKRYSSSGGLHSQTGTHSSIVSHVTLT
ncbi:DmX-like protein 2 [Geodia barretti]|uniref:DmX-like protein 2 n=1 Tax=Geodia barretti TaxID=519541 RepID=A0AA35W3T0_GEOBA|nr:DmX-like protein 2 [Geodia barretti]